MTTPNRYTLGTFRATDSMKARVMEVLESGRLSYGPASKSFEQKFAEVQEMDYGVLSNSGTSSLVTAVQALKELHGWSDGDEIITSSTTFVATINSILHNRMVPVLVDAHPRFLNIDVTKIVSVVSSRTRAIMPVSLFGWPCDMARIQDIAELYDLRIIADNCETTFGRVENLSVDAWADISCHSFYAAHTLVCGAGGLATTSNPDYAIKMRSLVNHGLSMAELPTGEHFEPSFLARNFRFASIGHSFRVTEIEAAIALEQLNDYRHIRSRRQLVASWIEHKLAPFVDRIQLPEKVEGTTTCPMVFPIVMRDEPKFRIMGRLRENGIECRDLVPLVNQPAYQKMWRVDDYPASKRLLDYGFYVGCHQDISYDDVEYLASVFADYLGKGRGDGK